MKRILASAVLAFSVAGVAHAADPAEGVWKTQPDGNRYAHVKLQPCGAAICGIIVKTFENGADYKSPNIGKQLVRKMVPSGGGKYAGKVWRPSNDKIYTGKMVVSGDSLKLSGCVAGGLICSKQTWSRIK